MPYDAASMAHDNTLNFAPALIRWQRRHGRHHLPWQKTRLELGTPAGGAAVLRDPYRVWLSEVMLQQTQVATVIPYFEAFLRAFPTVTDLAAADAEQVMGLWAGLGYYSRARNLHAAARRVAEAGGAFPQTAQELEALPGVGRSTAAAIAVFAFGERAAILDGNVKRVLSRVFAVEGDPAGSVTLARLWTHAEAELPPEGAPAADLIDYTQGLMDLGAMVCTRSRPDCGRCPLATLCQARQQGEPERYPQARRKRTVPVRAVNLLWVEDAGRRVLLQARPDSGLWGGLWSLPEWPGEVPESWKAVGGFSHVFTHFRMEAMVWAPPPDAVRRAMADQARANGAEGGIKAVPDALAEALPLPEQRRWLAPSALEGAPLPSPIQRWLQAQVLQPELISASA